MPSRETYNADPRLDIDVAVLGCASILLSGAVVAMVRYRARSPWH